MSKFNKIYEYEYHLFGQVGKYRDIITYGHMQLYVCPLMAGFNTSPSSSRT